MLLPIHWIKINYISSLLYVAVSINTLDIDIANIFYYIESSMDGWKLFSLLLLIYQSTDNCFACLFKWRTLVNLTDNTNAYEEAIEADDKASSHSDSPSTASDLRFFNCPIPLWRQIKTIYCLNAKDHGR